jgi:hypothetical protein
VLEPHTARNRYSRDGFDGGGAAKRSEPIPRGLPLEATAHCMAFLIEEPGHALASRPTDLLRRIAERW